MRFCSVLKESGYRFPPAGEIVIREAKAGTEPDFTWDKYVQQAEEQYEMDFPKDRFLKIKGVSYKTRDLALSELSERFIAIDLHVVRVAARTGLLLHGYGDTRITTDLSKPDGYLFFHDLMLRLSRRTGRPGEGYSPGEIDRMLWHFGRAVSGAKPKCGVPLGPGLPHRPCKRGGLSGVSSSVSDLVRCILLVDPPASFHRTGMYNFTVRMAVP